MATVLIITGPPGAGKTTISRLVSDRMGFKYIEGEKVRKARFGVSVYEDEEKNNDGHSGSCRF